MVLLQPCTDGPRAARQPHGDPVLQSRLLFESEPARTAFVAETAQGVQSSALVGLKPFAHGVVVQQQRPGHTSATPALIEQNNCIRTSRYPMLSKAITRHRGQRLPRRIRKEAAPLWDSRARTVPLEAGGDTGSRFDVRRGRGYRRAFGCDSWQRGVRIMTLIPPGVKAHLAFGYTDMRKGIDGLAMLVQGVLRQDPFSGLIMLGLCQS